MDPSVGPGSNVATGLVRSRAAILFFLPVDVPLVGSALILRIVQFFFRDENLKLDRCDGIQLGAESFPSLLRRSPPVLRYRLALLGFCKGDAGPSFGKIFGALNKWGLPNIKMDDELRYSF